MSLWTDWLDYIPVVGTVKNTVEAVSALSHGDYKLAKEKGESAAIGLLLDVLTEGMGHAAGTAAVRETENLVFKGATKLAGEKGGGAVFNDALKLTKGGTAAAFTLEDLIKESKVKGKPGTTKEEDDKKPSRRGEHVINNNVRKVFKTIIDRFAHEIKTTAAELLRPNTIAFEAYNSPLPEVTTRIITYDMVAHIPENETYVDANSTLYGIAIKEISDMVVKYMEDYYHNNSYVAPAVDRSITELINLLNTNQLYVDEYAKQYWLQHHGGTEAQFQDCRRQVVQMFRRLCAPTSGENEAKQWVRDLTGHT